jgi:hypothetical protein
VTPGARITGIVRAAIVALVVVGTAAAGGSAATGAGVSEVIPTTVTLTGPTDPIGLGDAFELTAIVSPATAPGTVTFARLMQGIASAPLFGGVATATVNGGLSVGTHEIVAQYDGSTNYAYALSEPITITVVDDRAAPVVTISADQSSALRGDIVRFGATVSPLPVTGMIELRDGGGGLYPPSVIPASGVLAVDIRFWAPGSHAVSACYAGDANLREGCSEPVTVVVDWPSSTTTLSVEPASIYPTESLTFSVTVDPPPEVDATVAIRSGGGQLRTWVAISRETGRGTTTIDNGALNTFALGHYDVYADFPGTNHLQPSRSPSQALEVHLDEATLDVVGPPGTLAVGQLLTFAAAVTPAPTTAGIGISVSGPQGSPGLAIVLGPDGTGSGTIDTDGWPAGDYWWEALLSGDPRLTRPTVRGAFTLTDTAPPTGTLGIHGGVTVVITEAIQVDATSTDGDGTGVAVIALSNDGTTWSEIPDVPGQQLLWSLGPGDGLRTVYARWRDRAGNWSDTQTATVMLNTAGGVLGSPTAVIAAPATIRNGLVPLAVTWRPGTSIAGVARYRVERSVDGGAWLPVAITTTPTTATWASPGHRVQFRVRAEDTTGASGPWATQAAARTPARVPSGSVAWTGRWSTVTNLAAWGSSLRRSTTAGSRVRFTMTGTGAAWVARTGPTMGVATVWVNGVRVARVDLYSPTSVSQRVVWSATWTTIKARAIEIRVVSVPNRTRVDVDALLLVR